MQWSGSWEAADPRGPWNQRWACLQEQTACAWWLIPRTRPVPGQQPHRVLQQGNCSTPTRRCHIQPSTGLQEVWPHTKATFDFVSLNHFFLLANWRAKGIKLNQWRDVSIQITPQTFSKCVWAGSLKGQEWHKKLKLYPWKLFKRGSPENLNSKPQSRWPFQRAELILYH